MVMFGSNLCNNSNKVLRNYFTGLRTLRSMKMQDELY